MAVGWWVGEVGGGLEVESEGWWVVEDACWGMSIGCWVGELVGGWLVEGRG